MANFEKAFKLVVEAEGGYVNDKDDKGGETFMGVTRKNHPKLKMWEIIDKYIDMYNSTYGINKFLKNKEDVMKEVRDVYKKEYWDKLMLDDVNYQRVANSLFDDCVNRGIGATLKLIRAVYGLANKTTISQIIPIINANGRKKR